MHGRLRSLVARLALYGLSVAATLALNVEPLGKRWLDSY
jgi:hypothetical protein